MQIPMLDFDQDFSIVMDRGEGSAADIHYNLQQHGDPLLYVQAFIEPPETKAQGLIRLMDYEQYLCWDEYYLFQEALGEVVDIRSITRDSSDESDSQMTSASHQMPMGSSKDLLGAAGGAPPEPEAPEEEQP